MAGRRAGKDRLLVGLQGLSSIASGFAAVAAGWAVGGPVAPALAAATGAVGFILTGAVRARRRDADFEWPYLLRVQEQSVRLYGQEASSSGSRASGHPSRDQVLLSMDVTEPGVRGEGRRPVMSALEERAPSVITLIGGPGTGKTFLLGRLAARAAEREPKSAGDLPVLLRLRDCAPGIDSDPRTTLVDVVGATLGQTEGDAWSRWLEGRLQRGGCLVLLDALDELDHRRRQQMSAWLTEQVMRYPRNTFLVTSRELPARWLPGVGGRVLYVEPPTDGQVTEYLLLRLPHLDRAALRAWLDMPEPARNPLLLAMLVRLNEKTGRPLNPAIVYGELLRHQLEDARPSGSGVPGLSSEQKLPVIQVLALSMAERGVDTAPESWCVRAIEGVLRNTAPLHPVEFLHLMVEEGVLVEPAGGVYSFAHRGFLEYLAAEQIRAQGSVRLLIQHMTDPRWREIILAWAASADASRFIEACLRHGTDEVLQLARDCAEVSPRVEPELRAQLSRPQPRPGREVPSDAFTAFVEKAYSAPATALLDGADRDRPVSREEIDALLARTRSRAVHESTEADATAFFSAAVLATERADHRSAGGYRFKGLVCLAHALRGKSLASSRDLALAALRLLDPDRLSLTDLETACLAYLGSAADARRPDAFADALRASCREAGAAAFPLLLPLVAAHREAARRVVGALPGDAELVRGIADALGTDVLGAASVTGWDAAVDAWHRARREALYELGALVRLELAPPSLLRARELVAEREADPQAGASGLDRLARALDHLDDFLHRTPFDEREKALRAAARQAEMVRAAVRGAPTELSVQVAEPAAARIEEVVREARARLVRQFPPRPRIGAALPVGRIVGRTLTVPVEVANDDERSAPVEQAALVASGDPAVLEPAGDAWTEVPAPVPGGAATTVLLRLCLTEAAQDLDEVEVRVAFRYRSRDGGAVLRQARLTFAVDRGHRPVDPNPYAAGNTGNPLDDPAMLFGREELIDKVRATLRGASAPGAGIAIFGQKRTGKSSIGVELMRRLSELDGLPVVDVDNLGSLAPGRGAAGDQATVLGSLLWRIVQGADDTVRDGPRLIPAGFDRKALIESPDPVADCARLFQKYRTARPDSPPWVVVIDEFQYMDQWIREGVLPPSFMQTFKAIVERRLFHLVLVGQTRLERLIEEDPNAFGVFGLERVTCLAAADARALIEQPVLRDTPEGPVSRHHDRAVAEILRLAGGNPFYTQKICYELVRHMNKERATTATDADVRQVTRHLLDRMRRSDFDGLESPDAGDGRWTEAELKAALGAVARACTDGPASPWQIRHCHEGELPAGLLDHLVLREVVRPVGDRYEFVVGLFEEWLRRYCPAPEGCP
ncbi:NACHT domain-containing protein [Streptomyces sp. NPDC089919]|uniref:NACHT domain-containing protein n=1 Tax=Streptomyces sp. NPDC089919 TaxID=3155188 RepID=UPI00341E4B32